MALIETESLILKSYSLAEADKIVVLFTEYHGVVRGVAKGAKRLKSKFGSGLEPFSTVRVTYFQKEVRELVSIQKVDLVRSYFSAAGDPEFLQKFTYLSDLIATISPPHDPNETLYRMVKACIDTAAADHSSLLAVGVYFELWLLRLNGLLPDWTHCTHCGGTFGSDETADISVNFHLVCVTCRRAAASRSMNGAHRAIFESIQRLSPTEFSKRYRESKAELSELSNVLKRIISQAVGRDIVPETAYAAINLQ